MEPRATRTIKEYALLFLRHHQVEGNTKDTYADTLRLHVIPFLGGCRLAGTERTVARNFITALQEEGRSANIIRQAKVVLGAMFGMAVADGYCRVWRKPTTTGHRRYCARWDTSSANCRKQQIGGPKPGDCRGLGAGRGRWHPPGWAAMPATGRVLADAAGRNGYPPFIKNPCGLPI